MFGKTRRALLGLLFTHDEESFYLREIIRTLDLGRGAVQRELARLAGAGLIIRTARGNQVFYQANRQSPVFAELKSLMVKTTGVADVIRDSLEDVSGQIKVAFLHGSIVTGTDTAASDIDLVVIGSASFGDVTEALSAAEDKLGREVNPTVYSVSEFRKKVKEGHHFVASVQNSPRIIVIGDEDELAGLG
ncbi:MAG: nucleotidyltransferase domain-containing protein [Actinomycetia bacterium]|nr:nucleotidyltransferase domain-containing protein [Actinomycetes bacterium]